MANSKRECKFCSKYVTEFIKVPGGTFCGIDHAIAFARDKQQKDAEKRRAKVKKSAKKDLREFNRKDVRWQHKQTQPVFNRMRVLQELKWFRDRRIEPQCISCGKELGGDQWCCGHFKTVGAQSGLRYDPVNTRLQHNRNCNMGLSGDIYGTKNTHGYIQGLKNRFGDSEGQAIIDHCETNTAPVKWEWQQLETMRAEFSAEIRRLEKDLI